MGSVTSVGITAPSAGITVSGGPITSTGSLSLNLSNDLAAIEALNSTGIAVRNGAEAWTTITNNSADWNVAYSERLSWDGSSSGLNASTARTSLGLGVLAQKDTITGAEISEGSIDFSDIRVTPCTAGNFMKVVSGVWICSPLLPSDLDANVSATEFGYLDGLSSPIQSQLNAKQATIGSSTTLDAGGFSSVLQNALEIKPYGTSSGQTGELRFTDLSTDGSFYLGFKAPNTVTANRIWTLPAADGSDSQLLKTDGAGNLGWVSAATGSVTSITAGTGLSGGTITGAGTIGLSNTDVTAASYTRANITVDAQGRLTAASNGAAISSADISDGTIVNADIATGAAIDQSKIANLSTDLSAKEPLIASGATSEYWRGDKSWQILNTSAVTEGANLYYSDLRARSALKGAGPIAYDSGSGTFSIAAASGNTNGYLSSADWNTFNNKSNSSNPTFSGAVSNALGSAAAPSYSFTGDGDSGLWSPGADSVGIATAGLNRLIVDANGNVGIGTATPSENLSLYVPNATTPVAAMSIDVGSFSNVTNALNSYYFRVRDIGANSTPFIISGVGNVGLGKASPSFPLHVSGSVNTEHSMAVQNTSSGVTAYAAYRLYNDGANSLTTFLNSSNRSQDGGANTGTIRNDAGALRLQSKGATGIHIEAVSGRVGIANSAPTESLEVSGNIKLSGAIVQDSWTAPVFQNSWQNYSSGWEQAGYMKDKVGTIHFKGLVGNGTLGQAIFTLPAEYRPVNAKHLMTVAGGTLCLLYVFTDGSVVPSASFCRNDWITLDGVSYRI